MSPKPCRDKITIPARDAIGQRRTEMDREIPESLSHGEKLSPSFSVGMLHRLSLLIPDKRVPVAGMWRGTPPRDTADHVLWRIAATVKFEPETSGIKPDEFRPFIDDVARLVGIDDDAAWRIFIRSYNKARSGAGCCNQVLREALFNAQTDIDNGIEPWGGSRYRDQRRRLLVGIMYYLLTYGPEGQRYLSCRDAAGLIGVGRDTAAAWIKAMVEHEYLEPLIAATEFTAPRFRWKGQCKKAWSCGGAA